MEPGNKRILPRPRLIRTLADAVSSHFLTVVTAPAGYGKTTIAKTLLSPARKNRFYHPVPVELSGPGEWWDSLFAGLAEKGLEAAPELRGMGFPQSASRARHAIRLLENVSEPFTIILDDCHNFPDGSVDAFLEALIRAEPTRHRLVMFSRSGPRMHLADLQRTGLAAVFDQALLKFSEAEAAKLFFLNGVPDRTAAGRAWRYSEGWVTALWLCAQSLLAGGGMEPADDIERLLHAHVFATYPADDRNALLRLSVLDHFTAAEAETLADTPGIRARLLAMSRENVLITHDEAENKYVFHSIFRDFLRKLAADNGVDTPDLYRRAAECHILRRDSLPAYRLLLRAGRDEDVLRILEVIASDGRQSIFKAKRKEFLPILEKIPWRLRLKEPLGYLLFIWLCFDDDLGDPAAVAMFREAAGRFAAAKDMPERLRRRLAGELEFMRGWIYTDDEPHLLASRYENARNLLDGPSILRYEQRCWNMGSPHALFSYLPKGVRYPDLFAALAPAIEPMRVLTGGVIEGCDAVAALEYRLERGEFEAAARLLDDLDQLLDFPWNMSSLIMARFSRARLLSVAGDEKTAAVIMGDFLRRIEATGSSEHIQCAELARSYVLANIGQPDAAPAWLRDGDIFETPYGAARVRSFMVTVCGKLLLAKGDRDAFAAFLSNPRVASAPVESVFGAIHLAILKAILAWRRQEEGRALASLREALDLSRPDGFVLPLGEYGGHVLPILRRLERERAGDGIVRTALDIAERMEAVQRRWRSRAKRALTTREREVMRLVAKGKRNAAIAEKLGLTESVVKHTLGLAYAKLAAKNRAEATRLFRRAMARKAGRKEAGNEPADIPADICRAKQALAARRFFGGETNDSVRPTGDDAAASPSSPGQGDPAAGNRERGGRLSRPDDPADALYGSPRAGRSRGLARALELFSLPGSGKLMAFCYEEIGAAVRLFSWRVRLAHPSGYLAFLWRRFRVFARGTSGVELDEAECRLSRAQSRPRRSGGDRAGEIALVRSLLSAHDVEALWDGHDRALGLLRGPSRLYARDTSWTFGNPHFSFFAVREAGGFERLAPRVASASKTLAALSGGDFTSLDVAFRLERHLERGEADAAHALLPELESRGDADMQALLLATFSRARLSLAEGRGGMAVDVLERLAPRVHRLDSFEHLVSLDLALGYVFAQLGRVDAIPSWIRTGNVFSPPYGGTVRAPFAAVAYAKALLAAGDFARLESAARVMPARFGRFDSLLGRIHAKVLEAIASRRRGDDAALAHLGMALDLSRPDGLVFSIAEYGKAILPLLRRLRRNHPGDGHLKRVLSLAERGQPRGAAGDTRGKGSDSLTPREREIMRLVVRGGSNGAIARRLGVSESRINKALSGIYAKLAVSNRAEASRVFDFS